MQDLQNLIQLNRQINNHPLDSGAVYGCEVRLAETLPFFEKVRKSVEFESLLEVGPGLGYDANWWAESGKKVVALDSSPSEILSDRASGRFEVVDGDMHDIPFPDCSFDSILSKHALEHSLLPMVAIEETRRVLKMGGYFMVITPTGSHEALEGHYIPGWNADQLSYLLAVCGFKTIFRQTHGWSACVLGQKVEQAYNGDYFSAVSDRYSATK